MPGGRGAVGLAAILVLLGGCRGGGGPQPLDPNLTTEAWAEDLRVLADELLDRHENAFHTVDPATFDSAVADLEARLPHLSHDSIYVGFRRIGAMIGDGHTGVASPPNWPLLPIRFRWFGDPAGAPEDVELRVTAVGTGYEAALGARVVGVGDSTSAGAYRALAPTLSGVETEGSKRIASALQLRSPRMLRGAGIVPHADSVRLVLSDASGGRRTLFVRPLPPDRAVEWEEAAEVPPRYRSRPDDPFWFSRLEDAEGGSTTIYLAFNGYPGYWTFWRESRRLFRYAEEHDVQRLVIDLRNNTGGDFYKPRRLLIPGLRRRAALSGPERLYVLIGPGTFSAAMTNALDFRRELGATLVGEPTGSRPNEYQEGRIFQLPNSGLRIGYATRYYEFQDEDTPGVLPDHHVAPSWADYRTGRDPVLEWVLARPLPP